MKFKTKLYTGFGAKLLLILILTIIMIFTIKQLNQSTHDIVKNRYEYVKLTTDIRNDLSNINRSLNYMIMSGNAKEIDRNIQDVYKYQSDTQESLKQLEGIIILKDIKSQFHTLEDLNDSYVTIENNVISLVSDGNKDGAREIMLGEAQETRTKLFATIDKLIKAQESLMDHALDVASEEYHHSIQNGFIFMFLFLFIGFGVTYWVIRSTTGSLRRITKVFSSIDSNNTQHLPRLEVMTKDEIGEISLAFNNMASALEEHAQKEDHLKQQMLEQNWIESNMSEITLMYQGVSDVKKLGNLIITKITPLIEATYGVFYIRERYDKSDQLIKIASYAASDENTKNVIQTGEGLVGQCAIENKKIIINQIPDGYIKISSGLGEAKPAHLFVLPIVFEGNAIGVLEFASFKPFLMQYQILLERVLRSIGISMNSILSYMEIQRLLEESQILTEELQSQSEELQLQQEELKSINEKLEDQYESSEIKTKELERIKLELEEKANQLILSNNYKSQFLANISHELRTPLNSLLILSQILTENAEQNLTEKQVEYAKTISSSGYDLLNLINDILDLSKIESGKMNLVMEEMRIYELSQFVKQQFQAIAEHKGLNFKLVFSSDLPESIKTDKYRLQQIIKNLLSNAFKFTSHGEVELNIKLCNNHLSLASIGKNHHMLEISVKDTGIGIPKDKQDLIFEAFQQADGTTSRKFGGTGLGLSICRELASLLGGRIEVESIEGKGSTFTLYLPDLNNNEEDLFISEVASSIEKQRTLPEIIEKNDRDYDGVDVQGEELLTNKKVLIIDDDMRNIFALTTALENRNIQVAFAENGKEGLKILEENPKFDLILMDIMMPVMDGFEAMKEIRNHSELNKIPIIAITAKAMKSDKEKCIEAGASDYISKPIDIEKLISLMKVWLNR